MAANTKAKDRRVAFATIAGTTIEYYDFFIYAQAAGMVFSTLMFEPLGSEFGMMLSLATIGISFLFRPLGAFLAVKSDGVVFLPFVETSSVMASGTGTCLVL